jgi:hypothetical protein
MNEMKGNFIVEGDFYGRFYGIDGLADIEKYSLESISIKIPPHKYQY